MGADTKGICNGLALFGRNEFSLFFFGERVSVQISYKIAILY